jgi:hypothetical protein
LPEREIVPLAEAVIAASGVPFRIGGDRAFYALAGLCAGAAATGLLRADQLLPHGAA